MILIEPNYSNAIGLGRMATARFFYQSARRERTADSVSETRRATRCLQGLSCLQ